MLRTKSLCPVCLRRIDAEYKEEDGIVSLQKICPEHGMFSVPVWQNLPHILSFEEWKAGKRIPAYPEHPATEQKDGCPFDCGLCPSHAQHTCTGLIEVTSRCSMVCPICYASASSQSSEDPSLITIEKQMDALARASGSCNLQLSGGEPTEREDLPEIIRLATTKGFALIQVNTNGIRLGSEQGYAGKLKSAGLDSIYLQFDAVDDSANRFIRGRDCLDIKKKAIQACSEIGLGIVLVCTIVPGINDSMTGDILRFALSQGTQVRGLHFQPVSSFGRFPWSLPRSHHITIPQILSSLEEQSQGIVHAGDFHPPSCEHPLCSFSAVYLRKENGLELLPASSSCCSPQPMRTINNAEGSQISRTFTAVHWSSPDKQTLSLKDGFSRFITSSGIEKRFTISGMAFQDALSLDLSRLRTCCIHIVSQDGRLIPFCAYNLTSSEGISLYRNKI